MSLLQVGVGLRHLSPTDLKIRRFYYSGKGVCFTRVFPVQPAGTCSLFLVSKEVTKKSAIDFLSRKGSPWMSEDVMSTDQQQANERLSLRTMLNDLQVSLNRVVDEIFQAVGGNLIPL